MPIVPGATRQCYVNHLASTIDKLAIYRKQLVLAVELAVSAATSSCDQNYDPNQVFGHRAALFLPRLMDELSASVFFNVTDCYCVLSNCTYILSRTSLKGRLSNLHEKHLNTSAKPCMSNYQLLLPCTSRLTFNTNEYPVSPVMARSPHPL